MTRDQRVRLTVAWLRRQHLAFNHGDRTSPVIAGERAYQALRRRLRRVTSAE